MKRLKNLKKREIVDRIEKLRDVTGDTAVGFTEEDVKGEFNEREHDEMMKVGCLVSKLHICAFLNSCLGANDKKILRLSYDVIITYDNRKSNLR